MKLGVMSPVLNGKTFEEALSYLNSLGVDCLELGVGGYLGKTFFNPKDFLGKTHKI